ncbi:hypothetical protein P7K49_017971 [Saguinus oedipus]|uniref:Uncharacterized protein n=1 Tax=Saguinus oedipus TaxID=9490 RepID=A0ABQ9V4Y3_SAGOE|nr:hypothetical protein P7K49_017971 [Saguinus oedipus]
MLRMEVKMEELEIRLLPVVWMNCSTMAFLDLVAIDWLMMHLNHGTTGKAIKESKLTLFCLALNSLELYVTIADKGYGAEELLKHEDWENLEGYPFSTDLDLQSLKSSNHLRSGLTSFTLSIHLSFAPTTALQPYKSQMQWQKHPSFLNHSVQG